LFEIKGIAKYKTIDLLVFNRWGNIVFQSKNYGSGTGKDGFWNGNAKGSGGPVPSGTYFYILKLDGKENINGSVYLDR
jgi:gliding motility-associated-like protein